MQPEKTSTRPATIATLIAVLQVALMSLVQMQEGLPGKARLYVTICISAIAGLLQVLAVFVPAPGSIVVGQDAIRRLLSGNLAEYLAGQASSSSSSTPVDPLPASGYFGPEGMPTAAAARSAPSSSSSSTPAFLRPDRK